MKIYLKLMILTSFLFCASCKTILPYTYEMKAELKNMYAKDQKAQEYDLKKVVRKEYSDSMEVEFDKLCEKNIIILKKYFKNYGFPGIKENGKETALNFWLITQHGDKYVTFQKQVLIAMKSQLKKKNVSPRNYAYLYDRVKKNENKPQLYGTQISWDSSGIQNLYNLKDPKKVNERRKEMELGTIEEYLKEFNH